MSKTSLLFARLSIWPKTQRDENKKAVLEGKPKIIYCSRQYEIPNDTVLQQFYKKDWDGCGRVGRKSSAVWMDGNIPVLTATFRKRKYTKKKKISSSR